MATELIDTRSNPLLWFCRIFVLSNCLLKAYAYTHRLVLLPVLLREASVCCRQCLMQTHNLSNAERDQLLSAQPQTTPQLHTQNITEMEARRIQKLEPGRRAVKWVF